VTLIIIIIIIIQYLFLFLFLRLIIGGCVLYTFGVVCSRINELDAMKLKSVGLHKASSYLISLIDRAEVERCKGILKSCSLRPSYMTASPPLSRAESAGDTRSRDTTAISAIHFFRAVNPPRSLNLFIYGSCAICTRFIAIFVAFPSTAV
jgi:hypothetical protein